MTVFLATFGAYTPPAALAAMAKLLDALIADLAFASFDLAFFFPLHHDFLPRSPCCQGCCYWNWRDQRPADSLLTAWLWCHGGVVIRRLENGNSMLVKWFMLCATATWFLIALSVMRGPHGRGRALYTRCTGPDHTREQVYDLRGSPLSGRAATTVLQQTIAVHCSLSWMPQSY